MSRTFRFTGPRRGPPMTYLRTVESIEEDPTDIPRGDRKRRGRGSRRKPWRDGLAPQTVIADFEDLRSYRAFERAICARFGPRSVIELELIQRLASLLWRLRRATAIETGLFQIQSKLQSDDREGLPCGSSHPATGPTPVQVLGDEQIAPGHGGWRDLRSGGARMRSPLRQAIAEPSGSRTMAHCFLRLSNLDRAVLERAGAYEARLWRQAAQTIWTLDALRRPPPAARRPVRKPVPYNMWDREPF
jgi:hypothetical protein